MGSAFWKRKEKFCKKIVACPSRDPTKPTFNGVYQDIQVTILV
jgi:hypothetical protein